jgi:hypothetical protein
MTRVPSKVFMATLDEKIIGVTGTYRYNVGMSIVMACLFVLAGVWMLQADSILDQIMGFASILFFGLCVIYGIKRLFSVRPSLVLNAVGMNYWTGISKWEIPWIDILNFEETEIEKQKFIVVKVKDPEKYVNGVNGRMNLMLCGSPILISPTDFNIDVDELVNICHTSLEKYGAP